MKQLKRSICWLLTLAMLLTWLPMAAVATEPEEPTETQAAEETAAPTEAVEETEAPTEAPEETESPTEVAEVETDPAISVVSDTDSYEEFSCGESKTITLEAGEDAQYSFTPTEDGTYVLYMPEGDYGENNGNGYRKDFSLSAKENGRTISDSPYRVADYEYASFEAKAGHTYCLELSNNWGARVEITGTVTLAKYTPPTSVKLEKTSGHIVDGMSFELTCMPAGGSLPFVIEEVVWTISDESVVSLYYDFDSYAGFDGESVGIATITATLSSGVSATYEAVVVEKKDYNILNENKNGYVKLQSDGTLVVQTNAPAEKFDYAYCDGDIPAKYCTVTESDKGAVITISAEYLATLENGEYWLGLYFNDGRVSTSFIKGTKYDIIGNWVDFIYGSGESLSFQVDAPCAELKSIDIFGYGSYGVVDKTLSPEHYTVTASGDATAVTLKAEYLEPLSLGYYDLGLQFENGFAEFTFYVNPIPRHVLNKVDGLVSLGSDGSLTIETDIPYNLFDWATLDADGTTSDLFTASASEKGTTVTLSAEHLKTLTPGYHWVNVYYISEIDGEQIHGAVINAYFAVGTKYEVTDGDYSVAIIGSDDTVTFKINAPLEKFSGITLYSEEIPKKYYTATASGSSTVITLSAEYLATLDEDYYYYVNCLYVYFTDGFAVAWFYLMEEPEYEFFDDSEDEVVSGSSDALEVHIDAPLEKFDSVTVDGNDVPSKYYTLTKGSTIITFAPEYLATLSTGTHMITAYFDDGYAYAKFEVQDKADYTLGDINGDGKINGKDGVLLAQYLAEWNVTIDMDAADVNGDGKVNGKDGVLLAQYLAEWNVTLGKQA